MKPRLFFFHSNGFPAKIYGHFLKTLETWNPEAINILGADLSSLGENMDSMVEEVISQVAPARGNAQLGNSWTASGTGSPFSLAACTRQRTRAGVARAWS